MIVSTRRLIGLMLLSMLVPLANARDTDWCVYDLGGANGDVMQLMKDYAVAAQAWGVNIRSIVYQNDEQAVEDFNAKKCDAVVGTNFSTKSLNNFTGTIGAVGLIPNHQVARSLFMALASPNVAQYMIDQGHEVVGWVPVGATYFMVKDRKINSITQLTGRRLGVLKYDLSQERMARRVGAVPVKMTVGNAAQKFISDEIDVLAAPVYAYQPFELHKALGRNGGVINYPISYLSMMFIVRQSEFPKDYGQKSRNWFKARTPQMMQDVIKWEKSLPTRYWYDIPLSDRTSYRRLVAQLRKEFIENRLYDRTLTNMVFRINCAYSPEYFECKF